VWPLSMSSVRKWATDQKHSKRTLDALVRHSWPGNIRELRNVIENALSDARRRARGAFAQDKGYGTIGDLTRRQFEAQHILKALERSHGRSKGQAGLLNAWE